MNQIFSITSSAANQIKKILSDAPADIDSIMVGVDKTGCSGYSYKIEFAKSSEHENFEKINNFGVKVLIDPKATMFLIGSTMDYKTDKLSSRFVFENPNEKNTCGCGESFSI
tara:strand:- start:586 stop:921 length:336 start_codon:yes stop_codon:yes gene_type:complete